MNQIRTESADLVNTILKMGHKRAYVHGVIMATGASSIFTQDVEDLPEEMREAGDEQPARQVAQQPQAKPEAAANGGSVISEAQAKRFYAIAKQHGHEDGGKAWLRKHYNLESDREIPKARYDAIFKRRQELAEERNATPYNLCPSTVMYALARYPPTTPAERDAAFEGLDPLRQREVAPPLLEALYDAAERAVAAERGRLAALGRPPTDEETDALRDLRGIADGPPARLAARGPPAPSRSVAILRLSVQRHARGGDGGGGCSSLWRRACVCTRRSCSSGWRVRVHEGRGPPGALPRVRRVLPDPHCAVPVRPLQGQGHPADRPGCSLRRPVHQMRDGVQQAAGRPPLPVLRL